MRSAAAIRKGALHGAEDPCQDAFGLRDLGGGRCAAAVSDGAGSARLSHIGSQLAVEAFLDHAEALLAAGEEELPSLAAAMVEDAYNRIAAREGGPAEHAATLVGWVSGPQGARCVQVGDGGAVVSTGQGFEPALWPEEAEFANSTYFVTSDDRAKHIQCRAFAEAPEFVALFTDGLQWLVLDPKTKTAHEPFFRAAAANASDSWLKALIASEGVTKRTDDDVTIVVMQRSEP